MAVTKTRSRFCPMSFFELPSLSFRLLSLVTVLEVLVEVEVAVVVAEAIPSCLSSSPDTESTSSEHNTSISCAYTLGRGLAYGKSAEPYLRGADTSAWTWNVRLPGSVLSAERSASRRFMFVDVFALEFVFTLVEVLVLEFVFESVLFASVAFSLSTGFELSEMLPFMFPVSDATRNSWANEADEDACGIYVIPDSEVVVVV